MGKTTKTLTRSIRKGGPPIVVPAGGDLVRIEAKKGRAMLKITVTPPPKPTIEHLEADQPERKE